MPTLLRFRTATIGAITLTLLAGCSSDTPKPRAARHDTTTTAAFKGSPDSPLCQRLAAVDSLASDDKTPETLGQNLEGLLASRDALVDAAPQELKADMEKFIDGYSRINDALKAVGYDDSKLTPGALTSVQTKPFIAATERIQRYQAQVCTRTPSNEATTSSIGSPPTTE